MDAISVLTCPRRPQYLAATLAGLDAAGAERAKFRLIVSDGWPAPHTPGRWSAVALSESMTAPIGARAAMWRVLSFAHRMPVDRLLYCEDDLRVPTGAVIRMLATPVHHDEALISFFDAKEFPGARRAVPGVHDVPIMGLDGKGLFGACCLLIPRRTIEWALRVQPGAPGMPEHADQALSWALRDSPWPLRGVHIPSLVEHVGDVSSMGHKAGQRAALFEG